MTPVSMTREQAQALIDTGHVVWPYPRKLQVKVDGWKTYPATKALCDYIKAANRKRLQGGAA